jgi:hypothetical protein
MKKTIFWKGLAFAAVALFGVFATSCSEEELKIQGGTIDIPQVPELANPVASLAITVLDFENTEVVKYEVKDISDKIGQSFSLACPAIDGYTIANDVTITVPSIQKGQAIVIPVTFYVVPLGSAIQDIVDKMGSLPIDTEAEVVVEDLEVTAKGALAINEEGVIVNDGDVAVEMEISVPYKSGYEYRGVESRSIASNLHTLKAETKIHKMTITVLPGTCVTITATQEKTPVILTIDGTDYNLWFYEDLKVKATAESLSHGGHGHGHGHGHGSGNAGGGITDAE